MSWKPASNLFKFLGWFSVFSSITSLEQRGLICLSYMWFSYLFPWFLCNWFCTWGWQGTFSPWHPAQDWALQIFWCWGDVCAQFSSQHSSPSDFPSTDAKAHYWTASMVINSNFSATSFWPPINPWCFVTQSWDMFQHDRIWHFRTISVPPPQLSVPSMFGRW